MKIQKTRYFKFAQHQNSVRDSGMVETLTYALAGTDGITLDDPRLRPIGEQVDGLDSWLLLGVTNPAYDLPDLPRESKTISRLNPDTLDPEVITLPGNPILGPDYFNSLYWEPYSLPISSSLVEITEAEYWAMESVSQKRRRDLFAQLPAQAQANMPDSAKDNNPNI